MPTKEGQSGVYKMTEGSQILFYIVKQGTFSPTKVDKENL